jgi:hypothetical protein
METIQKDIKTTVDQINPEKKEGPVATAIEEQTAKLPSDMFLWTAVGTMVASFGLKIFRRNDLSLFVGLWAPSFLLLGIYNKLVKQLGHDSTDMTP